MILRGARVALNAAEAIRLDIGIENATLRLHPHAVCGPDLNLDGFMILPGLVNAHDHLEFNLFPRLGRGPYPNATTWADEIFRPSEEPVASQLRLPKPVRLWWGGLKNLLSGVTSVAHHNPYE